MDASPRLAYIPALDGIRAFAVLAVLVTHETHFGPARFGFVGVDVFFVLSGFLITTLLIDEWQRTGTISLLRFFTHRIFRLMPALGVVLLVLATVRALAPPSPDADDMLPQPAALLAAATYTTNVLMAHGLLTPGGPLSHTWTLAAEAQFYVLWPFVLRAALPFPERRQRLLVLLACAIVGLGAGRPLALAAGGSPLYFLLSFESHVDGLMAGCLISCASIVTAAMIVSLIRSPRSRMNVILSLRLLRYIGKVSYSLYLWHLPMITVCMFVFANSRMQSVLISVVASLLSAIISFHVVESPARNLGKRLALRHSMRYALRLRNTRPGIFAYRERRVGAVDRLGARPARARPRSASSAAYATSCWGAELRRGYAARSYMWWRPPRTGIARIGPCRRRSAGSGVSRSSVRCGRAAL
jgi:peptidoglycan/LPS O-acetylase OafA/YrhL